MTPCLIPTPEGPLLIPARQSAATSSSKNIAFSLAIPTYNESGNISRLIAQIKQVLDLKLGKAYEIIVVDDNSPDGTSSAIENLALSHSQLKLICRKNQRGLATAVIRGWQVSQGAILGVIDGDLQHPPEVLADLLKKMDEGADIAIASRYLSSDGMAGLSWFRRMTSRAAKLLGTIFLGNTLAKVTDPMSGFFVVRRKAISERLLAPSGYKILIEVLARGTVDNIAEVPYIFQQRYQGKTKVTWREYLEYLWHLGKLRFFLARQGSSTASNKTDLMS